MSRHDLVCANCHGLVDDGRCPTCRAAREQLRAESLPLWVLLALIGLAALVSLALALRPA